VLDDFNNLPKRKRLSLLEIAGCHRSEQAASNVLAFYLDSYAEHHLGSLMLRSLGEALSLSLDVARDEEVFVHREVECSNVPESEEKRLDLVIEGPKFVVGIENKLFHEENNQFAAYRDHIHEKARCCGKEPRLALLNLTGNLPSKARTAGFVVVSYEQLFKKVETNLTECADSHYKTQLEAFMSAIKNLRVSAELREFLRDQDHEKKVAQVVLEYERITKELENELKEFEKDVTKLLPRSWRRFIPWSGLRFFGEIGAAMSWAGPVNGLDEIQVWVKNTIRGWRISWWCGANVKDRTLKWLQDNKAKLEVYPTKFEEEWIYLKDKSPQEWIYVRDKSREEARQAFQELMDWLNARRPACNES